jgi:hypothetical protein
MSDDKLNWQVVGDKDGFPHPARGMWEMVSDRLDGEKLPPTISRTSIMLASGEMIAVPEGTSSWWAVAAEPTAAMLDAAMSERDRQHPANAKRYLCNVWQKMLTATPQQPAQGPGAKRCTWGRDTSCDPEDSNDWMSGCGEEFSFIEGGPIANGFQYCPNCGRNMSQEPDQTTGSA